jgi:hypothetical protein
MGNGVVLARRRSPLGSLVNGCVSCGFTSWLVPTDPSDRVAVDSWRTFGDLADAVSSVD